MLRDATLTSFLEVLDSNRIRHELNKSESVLVMKDTGSRIYFRAVDDFERLRGTNLAWFGLDELTYTAEEAWLRLEGRLRDPQASRLCGFAVWTPKGFDWVYRRFVRNVVAGYEVVLAKPFENRHVLDKIPDFYERLQGSYDRQVFRAGGAGRVPERPGGRGLSGVSTGSGTCGKWRSMRALPLLWALDFNVDPMSSIVAQKSGEEIRVLDEMVLSRASTLQACEEFHARYPNHQAGIVIYGDASGTEAADGGNDGLSDRQRVLSANGVPESEVSRAAQQSERAGASGAGEREAVLGRAKRFELFVHPRCTGLVADFEEITFKPDSERDR